MFADADHEVIDSAAALFHHLFEEHGVEEARDLDPETAPVQFWLRRHAELERTQRATRRQEEPSPPPESRPGPEARPRPEAPTGLGPGAAGRGGSGPEAPTGSAAAPRPRPEGGAAGREGRRPAGFGDPLVEAMARALAGRGHDEAAVRAAIRSFTAEGVPVGEAAVRALFVEPMLRSAAERLLGSPAPPARHREEGRPEAAWAVLWAELGETRRRGREEQGSEGGDGDDLMAVANAVQQRRRVRLLRR